jgi:hypothetical protein
MKSYEDYYNMPDMFPQEMRKLGIPISSSDEVDPSTRAVLLLLAARVRILEGRLNGEDQSNLEVLLS